MCSSSTASRLTSARPERLTGETGAGKSILLDALGMVLGWKGRADVVRQGAERAEVTAVFDLSPPPGPAPCWNRRRIEPGTS